MTEKAVESRVVGSIREVDGVGVVLMEDSYDTTPEDLWTAMTDPARLARWIADVKGELAAAMGIPAVVALPAAVPQSVNTPAQQGKMSVR